MIAQQAGAWGEKTSHSPAETQFTSTEVVYGVTGTEVTG